MAQALRNIYQLKITLKDSKPPIWRRLLIADTVTLAKLHTAIQIVMGWSDDHLHQFIAGKQLYGVQDSDFDFDEIRNESKFRLNQVLRQEKDSLIYEYDFGDGWQHKVTLEKILPFDPATQLPLCIKAKGACPPEDVGGIWGYYEFLNALLDPDHPEHANYRLWIGGDFDPDAYDIGEVNQALSTSCR
ncbi:MAG: plasmid pRiA4b ORF-3 family protein [Gammaproteobacteria bacterium]